MTEMFGPNFAYGYLVVGIIIGFIVGRITAPKAATRSVGGGAGGRPAASAARGGTVVLETGGRSVDIDAETMAEVQRLAAAGAKIEAIKHLREATGLGLAEAKQLVETIEQMPR